MADRNTALRKFTKRGQIIIDKTKVAEDALMAAVLDAGADDMVDDGDTWEVLTARPPTTRCVKRSASSRSSR